MGAASPTGFGSLAGSANSEALFVQQGAVLGPELNSPVARALRGHHAAAERAISGAWAGRNAELDGLIQTIVPIPTMLDRRRARGGDLRVEEQRPRRNRTVRRVACEVFEFGA